MATRSSDLARRLSLKPYGEELLTRSADFWIFSARLIIVTMALAEGIAWAYMGALMSRAWPWAAAAIAGTFVFLLIWIIDATFMTLDVSRGFYERVLTGSRTNASMEKLRLAGGIAARVAIVSASLFITAPFLAQAIFAADVGDEMTRRNARTVANRRAEIERPFVARLEQLRLERKALEDQRVREAAGIGPSGKYGRGPALETIERQLADKRSETAAVEAARVSALAQFDRLTPPELEQKYGLGFLSPGVHSSGELLRDLLRSPQFTGAELAVRAFLAFLFLGLLILKVFQPRSVAVYYNEQLHSIHDEYRKGLFDGYLPEPERAGAGGSMEPLRFEDWCLNTYSVIRKEDERRNATAREVRFHELLVERWQQLESDARSELSPLVQRLEAALASIGVLEEELHLGRSAFTAGTDELHQVEAALLSMKQHVSGGGMDGPTFQQALTARRELEERRRALSENVREAEHTVELVSKRIEALRQEEASLRAEIATKQEVLLDAGKRIAEERMRLAAIIAQQREMWSGSAA